MRAAAALLALAAIQSPSRSADLTFTARMIDAGASETAAVADLNRDGRIDIISGEYWYQAPTWTKRRFREVGFSNNYIDSFSVLPLDVDGDGYTDIVDVAWFARRIAWWRNPGRTVTSTRALWTAAEVNQCCNVEFAVLADMNNDGRAEEVLAQENGPAQAWYEARNGKWLRHVVSLSSYGHGIGYGDVDGDKRNDILTPRGWLQAPRDPTLPNWTFHSNLELVNKRIAPAGGTLPPEPPLNLPPMAGAPLPEVLSLGFMHVLDVNGDGRNDILAAAGHDYGVFWFEQRENDVWIRHVIDNSWSQGHASLVVDLNGDGRRDFVTGKRFMAHNGSDPGEREPLGLYWYESRPLPVPASATSGRTPAAPGVEWIRHVIDYGGRIGTGMQIVAADLDADKDLDIVVGGKSGLFLLENGPARLR